MGYKILLPTDGSVTSRKAAEFAAELASIIPESVITVLTVITIPKTLYSRRLYWRAKDQPVDGQELKTLFVEEAQRLVEEAVEILRRRGIKATAAVREGDPAEEIVRHAHEGGFDHIIMGTRGLGGVQELILGGVARKVVHLASVPVTLVK
ncbi:MAG: universal stress protein [Bacillota bacterium]